MAHNSSSAKYGLESNSQPSVPTRTTSFNIPVVTTYYDAFQAFRSRARQWLAIYTFVDIEHGAPTTILTESGQINLENSVNTQTFYSYLYALTLEITVGSREFRIYRRSEFCGVAFMILQTLFSCYLAIIAANIYNNFPHISMTIPTVVIYAITGFMGWLVVAVNSKQGILDGSILAGFKTIKPAITSGNKELSNWEKHLERVWVVLILACLELQIIFLAIQATNSQPDNTIYTPKRGRMPDTIMISSMILPTIIYMVAKGITLRMILLCWVGVVILNGLILDTYQLNLSLVPYISMIPFTLFLLIEYHRQNWASFLITNRLKQVIVMNDRMAEEIKSNELRHMIGNVAHDLKTPLSSFVNGIEVVSQVSHEIQDLLKAPNPNNLEESIQKIGIILEIAQTVTNTNSFMMMTINRCIDYNKTMYGLKLQPRLDIVNLNDSLIFPISCLKTLSSKEHLPVEILPIPEEICNLIHTDKQWLQENLLCLLGNAVKYSSRGNITLKLYLLKSKTKKYPIPTELISLMSKPRKKPQHNNATNGKKYFKPENSRLVAISHDEHEEIQPRTQRNSNDENTTRRSANGSDSEPNSHTSTSPNTTGNEYLYFEIEDTGPGMKTYDLSIFQEPKQASRLTGGTGLGLFSLAKRLDALYGDYGVRQRTDGTQGTCFWFAIPHIPHYVHGNIHNSISLHCTSQSGKITYRKAISHLVNRHETIDSVETIQSKQIQESLMIATNAVNNHVLSNPSSGNNSPTQRQIKAHADKVNDADGKHQKVKKELEDDEEDESVSVVVINDDRLKDMMMRPNESSRETLPSTTAHASSINLTVMSSSQSGLPPLNTNNNNSAPMGIPRSITLDPEAIMNKKLNVLIVDDSMVIIKMAKMLMQRNGHTVFIAENGKEAVDFIQQRVINPTKRMLLQQRTLFGNTIVEEFTESHSGKSPQKQAMASSSSSSLTPLHIDVIIMDFQMPIMGGIEAIKAIRQLEDQENGYFRSLHDTHSVHSKMSTTSASVKARLPPRSPMIASSAATIHKTINPQDVDGITVMDPVNRRLSHVPMTSFYGADAASLSIQTGNQITPTSAGMMHSPSLLPSSNHGSPNKGGNSLVVATPTSANTATSTPYTTSASDQNVLIKKRSASLKQLSYSMMLINTLHHSSNAPTPSNRLNSMSHQRLILQQQQRSGGGDPHTPNSVTSKGMSSNKFSASSSAAMLVQNYSGPSTPLIAEDGGYMSPQSPTTNTHEDTTQAQQHKQQEHYFFGHSIKQVNSISTDVDNVGSTGGNNNLASKSPIKVPPITTTQTPTSMIGDFMNSPRDGQGNIFFYHPIIGFSAKSDVDAIREGFEVGMDAFMPKPFTIQAFHDTYMQLMLDDEDINEIDDVFV